MPLPPGVTKSPDKIFPSEQEWKEWNDPSTYGIWLDGQRIQNEQLMNRDRTSVVYFHKSKLYKNAVNYGKHTFQLDLYTEPYFDKVWAAIKSKKNQE